MLKNKTILFVLFLLITISAIKAQSYDGGIDEKLFLGYTLIGGKSGIEIKYEHGINDLVSYGTNFIYLFYESDLKNSGYTDEKIEDFFYRTDIGVFINFHFFPDLITPGKYDLYAGPSITLKSLGLQAGLKYNFSEKFGLYAQVLQSFSRSFYGIAEGPSDFINNFGKKTYLAAGLTYNFF